jgi:uncharacterized protein (DUF1330 family)
MQVTNAAHVNNQQAGAFFSTPDDGPIVMINLLKFKEFAEYEDGSDASLSGEAAYLRYGALLDGPEGVLAKFGAKLLYSGKTTGLLLGEVEEEWDAVALVEYPSTSGMLAMVMSPEYNAIDHHRYAGLAGQLNIRSKPLVN